MGILEREKENEYQPPEVEEIQSRLRGSDNLLGHNSDSEAESEEESDSEDEVSGDEEASEQPAKDC